MCRKTLELNVNCGFTEYKGVPTLVSRDDYADVEIHTAITETDAKNIILYLAEQFPEMCVRMGI